MDNSKIVIIGAYGQLGKALSAHFEGAVCVDRDELDITNAKTVEAFDWAGKELIINAAAYTNVDGAETEKGRRACWQINAMAVSHLAKTAIAHDLAIIHISTDYVFDGTLTPHAEDESLTPISVYGQTKAAGDLIVSTVPKHYVLRISWLIGDGPNFIRAIMGIAAKNISPSVVCDQVGRLTFTTELVGAIDHLLTHEAAYGSYNFSSSGEPASLAQIATTVFQELGREDLIVQEVTTDEYYLGKAVIAARPRLSTFDLSKIEATGYHALDWAESLHKYIRE